VALRELTVNAVAHRDWSYSGAYIRIQMFPDCIEWISPGGFPGRAPLSVQGLRPNGKWRLLGHTAANRKGVFRFVAPVRVRAVVVEYPGDTVTLPSRARARAERQQ